MKSLAIPTFLAAYLVILGCGALNRAPEANHVSSYGTFSWGQIWHGEFQYQHSKFSD